MGGNPYEIRSRRLRRWFGGEYRLGWSVGDNSLVQEYRTGEMDGENAQIVGADDHRFSLGGEFFQSVKNQFLGGDIHMIQGLVQEHEIGVMSQSPGEHHPLLLSPGKFTDLPIGQSDDFHRLHGGIHSIPILGTGSFKPSEMDITPHHHHLPDRHGKPPVHAASLGNDSHSMETFGGSMSIDIDGPGTEFLHAEHQFDQCGLTRTVGSDQGDALPSLNGQRN
jgi:hypothetical protein